MKTPETELDQLVQQLKQYAIDNYNVGGHWAYETYDKDDYIEILQRSNTFDQAKAALRAWCERVCEQESNCAWDGPSEEVTAKEWTA